MSSPATSSVLSTEIKSRSALEKLTKKDLVNYAIDLGENFEKLNNRLFDPENGIIAKLQSQLEISARVNSLLSDRLVCLEKTQNQNSQYLRKETLEVHKFPKDLPDSQIETKVLEIFNAIKDEDDEPYTAMDFHACHRLHKKDRVIVKMTHRKRLRAVVKSRPKLANSETQTKLKVGRVYIVESLAGAYKSLLYQCQQLKSAGRISACWFFNGNINVQVEEKGTREHISHSSDILSLLGITDDMLTEIVKKKY